MNVQTRIGGRSHDLHFTNTEGFTVRTKSAVPIPATICDFGGLPGQPLNEFAEMHSHAVTSRWAMLPANLAYVPHKRPAETVPMALIPSIELHVLETKDFKDTISTQHNSAGVLHSLTGVAGGADRLLGISLRAVLHFDPHATLAQQETAIEKTVQAVQDEVVRTQVDGRLRIIDLWMVLRLTCQDLVIDVGDPNRPFPELLLWRDGQPEPLTEDYILQLGERLIVELSLPAAIDIQPAGV